MFLFVDTQVVFEGMLEDINNILNSGEVPNLFANDEWEKIISACRKPCEEAGITPTKDNIKAFFVSRVRENLHIVLCMSPVGSAFRVRCRMFPSLINCCTIDWFDRWPDEALLSVSRQVFEPIEIDGVDDAGAVLTGLCEMSKIIHSTVIEKADEFFAALKRRFYVTQKSFLELLSLYSSMLEEKRELMDTQIERLSIGCAKLNATNSMVQGMKEELNALQPELERKTKETESTIITVTKEKADADKIKATVAIEEKQVSETAVEVGKIAADAQADLNAAMPAMNAAVGALNALSKNDITEIKSFAKPPPLVQTTMECVCLLLGQPTTWDSAKKVLGDSGFMGRLQIGRAHV